MYTEKAPPNVSNIRFTMEDRLEAIANFAKLLERSDEKAMDAINKILVILKDNTSGITRI